MLRVIAVVCLMLIATPAFARHHHHATHHSRHVAYKRHRHHHEEPESIGGILKGSLEVAGRLFDFVTGGRGRGRIPYGDWQITPDEVGSWGKRHGAIGLNHGDDMPDPRYKTPRDGIEIHAAESHTAGCVGIRNKYDELKKLVLQMIKEKGQAWLHIHPDKQIITPAKVLVSEQLRERERDADEHHAEHEALGNLSQHDSEIIVH